jgi:hypothetical protein
VLLLSLLLDIWWRLWCCPANIVRNYTAAVNAIITLTRLTVSRNHCVNANQLGRRASQLQTDAVSTSNSLPVESSNILQNTNFVSDILGLRAHTANHTVSSVLEEH